MSNVEVETMDTKIVEAAQRALAQLKERKTLAGSRLTQADIAAVLDTHPNTVARWERGEMTPSDRELVKRLTMLAMQSGVWYLRVAPFVLGLWAPGSALEEAEQQGTAPDRHASYFDRISFEPVHGRNDLLKVEITVTAAVDFGFASFFAVGPDRPNVGFAHTSRGPWESTIRFPVPRRARAGIGPGEILQFFIHYAL